MIYKAVGVAVLQCVATDQGLADPLLRPRNGRKWAEPCECLTCFHSQVGEPYTLQAACLSACFMSRPLLPSVAPIVAPVLLRVTYHHRLQQGVPTCLSTRGEQSQQDARNYIT